MKKNLFIINIFILMIENKITVIDTYVEYLNDVAQELTNFQNNLYNEYDNTDNFDNVFFEIVENCVSEKYNQMLIQINSKIESLQSKPITNFYQTGITHEKLDIEIQDKLLGLIRTFADNTRIDYHPGSDNKVRDLVHPSVYPYNKNVKTKSSKFDFFKRPYESSKYQWLPSEFKINSKGNCEIKSYINNLPVSEKQIYEQIEKLFDKVLPEFEKAYSYTRSINIFYKEEKLDGQPKIDLQNLTLKNKQIQVITKIVQVTLGPNEKLLGSWHVEGMSHENIIATASCTLDQPEGFNTDLYFKRGYYEEEAGYLLMSTPQNPPSQISKLFHENLVPIGKLELKSGSLVVFPNNFVHKVDMCNLTNQTLTRTILVFWLINPDEKIKSTNNILQQTYDWEEVEKTRLDLMKERTFYKQTFNQREINLCEH